MIKELKFKLTNKTLPLLPAPKREMLKSILMEGDKLVVAMGLSSENEYINDMAGFNAKLLEINADLLDDAACDVKVSKIIRKKALKERSKLGYGEKSNIYAIREFVEIYKDYPLEFSHSLVGNEKVHLFFKGKAGVSVVVMIHCNEIIYKFND